MHASAYPHIQAHPHINTYIHTPSLSQKVARAWSWMNTYMHTCIHTYTHTYIHIHIHTYSQFEPGGRARVVLDEKDSGLAPGQFAAFYNENECLGAGSISDSTFAPFESN